MKVKDLLAKEYALRPTRLNEDFEQGQPEMFDDSDIIGSGPMSQDMNLALQNSFENMKRLGRKMGDKAYNKIGKLAETMVEAQLQSKHIDIDANAKFRSEYDDRGDYLNDSDEIMEMEISLAQAFEDGFSESWFYEISMRDN